MSRFIIILFALLISSSNVFGASGSGQVVQKVVRNLSIQSVSELNFGVASAGDGSKTIAPGRSENAENGSFLVEGEPGASFRILLPPDGVVKMSVSNSNAPQKTIAVNQFNSYPSQSGVIDSQGEQRLFIGATREALLSNQASGNYKGYYRVTVVY